MASIIFHAECLVLEHLTQNYYISLEQMDLGVSVMEIWGKAFKSGSRKICGRQPLKNFKGYGKQTISIQIF